MRKITTDCKKYSLLCRSIRQFLWLSLFSVLFLKGYSYVINTGPYPLLLWWYEYKHYKVSYTYTYKFPGKFQSALSLCPGETLCVYVFLLQHHGWLAGVNCPKERLAQCTCPCVSALNHASLQQNQKLS